MRLSKQPTEETIPRFHGIRVIFDDGNKEKIEDYRIMDSEAPLEAKGFPKYYIHKYRLIEPTKIHEKIFIGSKKFSRNKDGTAIYNMYQVLTILRDIAYVKTRDKLENEKLLFNIPDDVRTILNRIPAPEYNFTNPTLREAIDGLLSFIDATYELDVFGNIILRFFNKKTGDVTDIGTFDDSVKTKEGQYYQTEMDVIVKNAVNDRTFVPLASREAGYIRHTIVNHSTFQNALNALPFNETGAPGYNRFRVNSSTGAYFRTEGVVLGDTNQVIKLQTNLKFYNLEAVYIGVKTLQGGIRTAEVTNYFKTEAEYKALSNQRLLFGLIPPNDSQENRQNTVRYNLFDNTVRGFGETWGIFGLTRTLDNMIRSVVSREQSDPRGNLIGSGSFPDVFGTPTFENNQVLFTFAFAPVVSNIRIRASRTITDSIGIKSSVRENQDENIVNMQKYGSNLLAKSNRFGNTEWSAPQTLFNLDNLYERGNKTPDGYVVVDVEKIIYPEFLKVKYQLTKDFNRYSRYVGIAARKRQMELLPDETVDRLLNYTEYLQLLPGDINHSNDTVFSNESIQRIMQSLIFADGTDKVRGMLIESDEFNIDTDTLQQRNEIPNEWEEVTFDVWNNADEDMRSTYGNEVPGLEVIKVLFDYESSATFRPIINITNIADQTANIGYAVYNRNDDVPDETDFNFTGDLSPDSTQTIDNYTDYRGNSIEINEIYRIRLKSYFTNPVPGEPTESDLIFFEFNTIEVE